MSAAQVSGAGCIRCEGGTQCEKRHSTVLSCASAGPAPSSAAASMIDPRCLIMFLPKCVLLSPITFSALASFRGGLFVTALPECVGARVILTEAHRIARLFE